MPVSADGSSRGRGASSTGTSTGTRPTTERHRPFSEQFRLSGSLLDAFAAGRGSVLDAVTVTAGLAPALRPAAHVEHALFKIRPCPAPLPERAEELLQRSKLPVVGGQLRFQRRDAASLCGDAVGDRGHLRRRKAARKRKYASGPRQTSARSGEALQPPGDLAELADIFLNQAGNHAGCAVLILGHRRNPFRQARSGRCLHAIMPGRLQVTLPPVDQLFNFPRLACPRGARCASQASAEPTARSGGNLPFAQASEARVRSVAEPTARAGRQAAFAQGAGQRVDVQGPEPAPRPSHPQLVRQPPVQDSVRPQHIPRPGRRPPHSVAVQPGRLSAQRRARRPVRQVRRERPATHSNNTDARNPWAGQSSLTNVTNSPPTLATTAGTHTPCWRSL